MNRISIGRLELVTAALTVGCTIMALLPYAIRGYSASVEDCREARHWQPFVSTAGCRWRVLQSDGLRG
jgi:hypothetical protein